MKPRRLPIWFLFVAAVTFQAFHGGGSCAFAAAAAEEEGEAAPAARVRLRAGELTTAITLDGILDEAQWQSAPDSIGNLVTIEPEEGGVPVGRTVVKVLASGREIVIGVRCYDPDPAGIVAFSKARDADLTEEDHVVLVFDTYQDDRSGYVFAVNAAGARFDGIIIERGSDVNSNWDAIWEAQTSRDETGWSAEIRLPIQSLGFEEGLEAWGFNVQRRVERLQETSRWSSPSLDLDVYQTSAAGLLTALPEFDYGLGLSVRPALVGVADKRARGNETLYDGEASLDVTQRIGSSFLSSLTVNTDFAETEVDVRQINLTRFPAFFPEKRTFFLAGADIFEFGLGLDEESLIPFFSRRIGLVGQEDEQVPVPINAGGKINGRIGDTSIGALVVGTREADKLVVGSEGQKIDVAQATMGAFRIRHDVLEESAFGMLFTFGDQLGREGSVTGGMDLTLQTSSFLDDKNLVFGAWGLFNDRKGLGGDKLAYGFQAAYPNDLLDVSLSSIHIGDGFDPSLGFVPRNDGHLWEFSSELNPRPGWSWLHQMYHEGSISLFNDQKNDRWQNYESVIKPLDWLLATGDRFFVQSELVGDRPPAAFELVQDVDIPKGSYEWTRYVAGVRSADKRRLSGAVLWETGNFYNGDLETVSTRLTVRPSALLTLEATSEKSTGHVFVPEDESIEYVRKSIAEKLYGFELQLNFSSDLQFSSLTQYDTGSREVGSNNRLRWTFRPSGDLFVVYNHNALKNLKNHWEFVSNQLPLKIQYAWRF